MATAVLFAFPTAVAAQHLRSARFPAGRDLVATTT
jgi:hypothetical protein